MGGVLANQPDSASGKAARGSTNSLLRRRRLCRWHLCLAAAPAVLLGGCAAEAEPPPAKAAVPVVVATAVQKSVPEDIRTIGTVQPYATISVKARVSGQVMKVGFTRGQEVAEGALLFAVDPRPFEAELRRAKAARELDMARQRNTEDTLRRYELLLKTSAVSKEDFDLVRTNVEVMAATVERDHAAVDAAEIELGYCKICSPINGYAGDILVDEGNVVKAEDTPPLVVLDQIRPVYVRFAVAEQYLPEIRRYMAQGPLEVHAILPKASAPLRGELAFIDNTVDTSTGTIHLKGKFANEGKELWPGQFVDVVLRLRMLEKAVVVPSAAIQTGQAGDYLFVVRPDHTVESRPVVKGIQVGAETVVGEHLQAGECVVTEGQLRLAPGVEVTIKDSAASGGGAGP
jgi:membrane fusion protein, multidrug efflux system